MSDYLFRRDYLTTRFTVQLALKAFVMGTAPLIESNGIAYLDKLCVCENVEIVRWFSPDPGLVVFELCRIAVQTIHIDLVISQY